jgi:phosphoribosylanthranilate isomerase
VSPARIWIKICGITSVEDAELALAAGADAIGLNFVAGSPRAVERARARQIVEQLRGRIELVGVIADLGAQAARRLRAELALDTLQLHGDERPDELAALLPGAFKAVRIASESDAELALAFGGERLLVDAKVEGQRGGTGVRVDPAPVRRLVAERRVILAGGLRPENVQSAISELRPWGVDVASGVEARGNPRRKDPTALRAFCLAARTASA